MKKANVSQDHNICVGVITAVNGVKGYVKIRSFTENPDDLASFKEIFDDRGNTSYKISVVTAKKDYIIAGIEGVNNRNQAETLRNTKLFIKRSELPDPSNNEYYHADLLGVQARSEAGAQIGIVKNVLNFGAGDILEIFDVDTEKTIYYPFTKQYVPEVNLKEKYLVLKALEEIIAAAE